MKRAGSPDAHADRLIFRPLDAGTWRDFEYLFGPRGACGGCWCMSWRLGRSDFESGKGAGNKRKMRRLVSQGEEIGIIAYSGKTPVGWCAVAPREFFVRLENSRVLRRVDDREVWSITCLFIEKGHRRQGISGKMLGAAIEHCRTKGVKVVEAYPVIPYSQKMPAAFAWTGIHSTFLEAGFIEEKRWSHARPIVRYYIGDR